MAPVQAITYLLIQSLHFFTILVCLNNTTTLTSSGNAVVHQDMSSKALVVSGLAVMTLVCQVLVIAVASAQLGHVLRRRRRKRKMMMVTAERRPRQWEEEDGRLEGHDRRWQDTLDNPEGFRVVHVVASVIQSVSLATLTLLSAEILALASMTYQDAFYNPQDLERLEKSRRELWLSQVMFGAVVVSDVLWLGQVGLLCLWSRS